MSSFTPLCFGNPLERDSGEEMVSAPAARHPCRCLYARASMCWCGFFRGFKKYSLGVVDETRIN